MKAKVLSANTRYAAQVDALLKELAPLGDERLNRKPADGGWSAMQTLYHLILVDENSLAYLHKKLSFNPPLEKAGLGAWSRSILLHAFLLAPLKFKAPKAAGNEHIPETGTHAEIMARWQKIRGEWVNFFEQMPAELIDKAVYNHPRAGRLGWLQMINFFVLHFERHRKQVRRAIL